MSKRAAASSTKSPFVGGKTTWKKLVRVWNALLSGRKVDEKDNTNADGREKNAETEAVDGPEKNAERKKDDGPVKNAETVTNDGAEKNTKTETGGDEMDEDPPGPWEDLF